MGVCMLWCVFVSVCSPWEALALYNPTVILYLNKRLIPIGFVEMYYNLLILLASINPTHVHCVNRQQCFVYLAEIAISF